jgi:hypothetical protein
MLHQQNNPCALRQLRTCQQHHARDAAALARGHLAHLATGKVALVGKADEVGLWVSTCGTRCARASPGPGRREPKSPHTRTPMRAYFSRSPSAG